VVLRQQVIVLSRKFPSRVWLRNIDLGEVASKGEALSLVAKYRTADLDAVFQRRGDSRLELRGATDTISIGGDYIVCLPCLRIRRG